MFFPCEHVRGLDFFRFFG
ncbi:unnamed protein product [Spirodela intermedia]|uniref:Uncharacterized protein n=1 Tax=Spirodela intermedia TaxID=51605 RepID=A0A7I8J7D0_SPIIN|nr:unnamed protein product [Spirodela intermedia]CAA6665974.1 unnamed protein product [Spirodela intermedia]